MNANFAVYQCNQFVGDGFTTKREAQKWAADQYDSGEWSVRDVTGLDEATARVLEEERADRFDAAYNAAYEMTRPYDTGTPAAEHGFFAQIIAQGAGNIAMWQGATVEAVAADIVSHRMADGMTGEVIAAIAAAAVTAADGVPAEWAAARARAAASASA